MAVPPVQNAQQAAIARPKSHHFGWHPHWTVHGRPIA
jgi:hypothetical protein